MPLRYLFGFASIFPKKAERSVWIDALVQWHIHKIKTSLHYLFGFASIFPKRAERSVWINALVVRLIETIPVGFYRIWLHTADLGESRGNQMMWTFH